MGLAREGEGGKGEGGVCGVCVDFQTENWGEEIEEEIEGMWDGWGRERWGRGVTWNKKKSKVA